MTSAAERQTRYQQLSTQAKQMLALGESGRFEFKQEPEAVSPGVLAALANWVALGEGRDVAHVLVGVEEITDDSTGLVSGRPCGISRGLDRTVSRIQDVASKTRPIPVEVLIVEEGVTTKTPFVRIEVRPTMPPHFDDQGRRQTRQGRSTRALTDEEMLQIYLQREAGTFAARFRQISAELHAAVGDVSGQVDGIADAIEARVAQPIEELSEVAQWAGAQASAAQSAASSAEAAADSVSLEVSSLEVVVEDVRGYVGALLDHAEGAGAADVAKQRRRVWWALTVDTWERRSARAESIVDQVRQLLSADIALDPARNEWELGVWRDLLADRETQRGQKGSLKWWEAMMVQLNAYIAEPSYQAPELPDLRIEMQADLNYALDDADSLTRRFTADLE